MTIQEVCEKYGYSESTVKTQFTKVQAKLLKDKNIRLVKVGRGEKATYHEEFLEDRRALTMYQEPLHDILMMSDLTLINWDFHIFLAIVTTPMCTFRGTIEQLLGYMAVPATAVNKEKALAAIQSLINRQLIGYWLDPTDDTYFSLMLYHKVELEMKINYKMLLTCKELAEQENKQSWIPLLKTWIGVQMLEKNQPYTVADLQALTGMSPYQIRESNRILEKNEVYRTSRAYKSATRCLGSKVELNGFYNETDEGEMFEI